MGHALARLALVMYKVEPILSKFHTDLTLSLAPGEASPFLARPSEVAHREEAKVEEEVEEDGKQGRKQSETLSEMDIQIDGGQMQPKI